MGVLWLPWLVVLSGYDIRQRRLPNWLTLPGAVVVLIVAAVAGHGAMALAGGVTLAAVYLLVHLAAPTALGAGDVKLAVALGALTGSFGIEAWMLAAVAAPLLTTLWAMAVLAVRGTRAVPHGPSMCLASAVAMGLAG